MASKARPRHNLHISAPIPPERVFPSSIRGATHGAETSTPSSPTGPRRSQIKKSADNPLSNFPPHDRGYETFLWFRLPGRGVGPLIGTTPSSSPPGQRLGGLDLSSLAPSPSNCRVFRASCLGGGCFCRRFTLGGLLLLL